MIGATLGQRIGKFCHSETPPEASPPGVVNELPSVPAHRNGRVHRELTRAPVTKEAAPKWAQTEQEQAVCRVVVQTTGSGTGFVFRHQTRLCIATTAKLLPNKAAANLGAAEFFVKGSAEPQFRVRFLPDLLYISAEQQRTDVVIVACDEEELNRHGIQPVEIDFDMEAFFDKSEEEDTSVELVAHINGGVKSVHRTTVSREKMDPSDQRVVFLAEGLDGCSGCPVLKDGKVLAVQYQPCSSDPPDRAMLFAVVLHGFEQRLCMCSSVGEHELVHAVRDGNTSKLDAAAEEFGEDALSRFRTSDGRSLLYFAAFYGNATSLRRLREMGADLKETASSGESLAHIAAYHGHLDILALLCSAEVRINQPNSAGETPAHRAAQQGKLRVIEWLIDNGYDVVGVYRQSDGATPMDVAIEGGHDDVALLLEAAADAVRREREAEKRSIRRAQNKFYDSDDSSDDDSPSDEFSTKSHW